MDTNGKTVHLNREYDPEIRVRDVLFHLLYRWRSILAAVLLCALVFGGWQYLRVSRIHSAGSQTKDEQRYERDLKSYEDTLKKSQKNVKNTKKQLKDLYAYRDGSLLMQLDPDNTWAAEKKYIVTGPEGTAADVLAVYTGAMTADHNEAELEAAFGTVNAGYAEEVTAITTISGENAFTVTVYAAEKEQAEKGLAYVSRKIEEAEKQAQEVAQHTLTAAEEGTARGVIPDLSEKKYALNDEIIKNENKLKAVERALYNAEESRPLLPGNPVLRWALAGAVLGLLGMILIHVTAYAQRGKLRQGSEISGQYGIPLLGEMNHSAARRPGKGLDGLIEKLEFRKDRKTDDQVYDNAAVLVRETRGEGTLILAGTVREEVLAAVKAELSKRLGEDAEITVRPGFPEESGSAEDACGAGAVLWVEEKHVSRSRAVRRAAEVFETAGTRVIGTLVV